MLEELGLTPNGEAVYRAMLAHVSHGVADLALDTELPEDQVRAALNELADLELLRPSATAGVGLRPVSPEVGLSALLAAAEAEAARRHAQIEATRAAIAAIAAEHARSREGDAATRLVGLDAVRTRLEELQRSTRREVLSLNTGGAHRPDARSAAAPLNEAALRRGVQIRAICRESFRNDPDTLAYARWLTELGSQMRAVPTVPLPMIVIDQEIAILPLDPDDAASGALEVRSPGVIAAACALFEALWDTATPFGHETPTDQHGLAPAERTLLRMLSNGETDEAAARKLGVSLRTVRRMMAELLVRLQASSRFQAGVNATRRGWLE